LVVVLVFALVQVYSQTFEGAWSDADFGRTLYICVDGSRLYGFYSEVGILRGVISGNTFNGYWFEPGVSSVLSGVRVSSWGPATLVLSSSGNSFSGTYQFTSNPNANYQWKERKSSAEVPSKAQCWWAGETNAEKSLNGIWSSSDSYEALCDNEREQSFYSSSNDTFSYGYQAHGVYFGTSFKTTQKGLRLIATYLDDEIRSNSWTAASLAPRPVVITSSDHALKEYTYVTSASRSDCLDYYDSASGTTVLSVCAVAVAAVLSFLA